MANALKILIKNAVVTIFLFSFGCTQTHSPLLQRMAPFPRGAICRVAVLPFINQTEFSQGELLFYRIFMGGMVRTGYEIAKEGDIRDIYRQMNIYPGMLPDFEQIRVIANRLDVQLVVVGTVNEMTDKTGADLNPTLAVTLQLHEAKTGRTILSTYHRREGGQYRKVMHFGLVNTPMALAKNMAREILDSWASAGLKQCSN